MDGRLGNDSTCKRGFSVSSYPYMVCSFCMEIPR